MVRVARSNPLSLNEMFNHEPFLTKTFGGHSLLTNTICFLLENDCDEKKKIIDRGESFPGF